MFKNCFITFSLAIVLIAGNFSAANSARGLQEAAVPPVGPAKISPRILAQQSRIQEFNARIATVERVRNSITEHMTELAAARSKLQDQQDEMGVSIESFPEIIRSLQASRVELMIDLAGLDARRVAMEKETKEPEIDSRNTELLSLHQEKVKALESVFDAVKQLYSKGSKSQMEMFEAQRNLLDGKIRLAEAKFATEQLGDRSQLSTISLDRAEKKARLEQVEMLLAKFTSERQQITQVGQMDRKYEMLDENLRDVEKDLISNESAKREAELILEQLLNDVDGDDQ